MNEEMPGELFVLGNLLIFKIYSEVWYCNKELNRQKGRLNRFNNNQFAAYLRSDDKFYLREQIMSHSLLFYPPIFIRAV